jgi:hypothetical protein
MYEKPNFIIVKEYEDKGKKCLEVRRSTLVTDDDEWYTPVKEWLSAQRYRVVTNEPYNDPGLLFTSVYELYRRL